jgi:hypothetical protein
MAGEHQSASNQHNEGSQHFLARDIPLLLQRRIALDSPVAHLLGAIFKTSAVRHGRLLLGWCDAGSHAAITEETRLEGAFIPRTRSTAGHVAVFCCSRAPLAYAATPYFPFAQSAAACSAA